MYCVYKCSYCLKVCIPFPCFKNTFPLAVEAYKKFLNCQAKLLNPFCTNLAVKQTKGTILSKKCLFWLQTKCRTENCLLVYANRADEIFFVISFSECSPPRVEATSGRSFLLYSEDRTNSLYNEKERKNMHIMLSSILLSLAK